MKARLLQAIEIAKENISLKTACEYYGLEFNRAGFARCPFHSEKTASFTIHNNKGHCFGCGWSGDLIDFVQRQYGYTNKLEALRQISSDFSLNLYIDEKPTLSAHHDRSMKFNELKEKREGRNAAQQAREGEYHKYCSLFALMDLWRMQYMPTSESEDFDPRYAEAVKYYDVYKYLLAAQEVSECRMN